MKIEKYKIACGELIVKTDVYNGRIINMYCDNKDCKTPRIIQSLINEYNIDDIDKIIETIYCNKYNDNNYHNTCGKIIAKKLS